MLRVGHDTLTGRLANVLGWSVAPSFIDELQRGRAALVLDSLDEAQLLSGREHFIAFLKNVSETLGASPAQARQVIIFGRKDSVETAYLALSDFGVKAEICEINALSYGQSCELIDNTLDRREESGVPYRVHRIHSEPFGELRNEVFRDLAKALSGEEGNTGEYWEAAENFLGYPPVLLVLSERLAVENPAAALADGGLLSLEHGGAGLARGYLLMRIVEGILNREANKVREQIAKSLSLSSEDCRTLYTNEEQCLRVLGVTSSISFDLVPPLMLDAADKVLYEEQIASFALDHPFLSDRDFSNIVFSDYVRAFVATSPTSELFGVRRSDLLAACRVAGPFFAHFAHSLSARIGLEGRDGPVQPNSIAQVDELLIDELIRSYAAGTPALTMASYAASSERGGAVLMLEEYPDRRGDSLLFEIPEPSGVLELYSPLSRCIVVSDHGVVLAARGDEFEIGPNVVFVVSEIQINASKVTVSDESGEVASVLIVARELSHPPDMRVTAYPPDSLRVHVPGAGFQWRPFIFKISKNEAGVEPAISHEVFFWIRRIIMSFRSGAGDNPSLFGEMFDRLIVGSSRVAEATADALIELKIVIRRSDLYVLDLGVLSTFQVSYAAVKGPDFMDALKSLQKRVLETDAIRKMPKD
ncbi:hypothetical protein AB0P21_38195 [Kribbella sp. NPDC056861]|uniref:hypothetical protein n=1 Tax=Kribbella sp. NPDC056861 TaxID=3154857 RepID=UPI0034286C0A